MVPRVRQQELTAHNIANVSTPGYKRDQIFTRELSRAQQRQAPRASDWETPMIDEVYTDYEGGAFDKTGNPLDLAIDGDGFFQLELLDGSIVLTRSGAFTVNSEGFLSFPGGPLVMGEGGPIEIGSGKVTVTQTGTFEVDGIATGRIIPVTVADLTTLSRVGNSSFAVPEGTELLPVLKATLRQGYLEASNVDIVGEMIDMIVSFRAYEANANALKTQDRSLDHLFNRVGRRS